jgi:hypothetical protein
MPARRSAWTTGWLPAQPSWLPRFEDPQVAMPRRLRQAQGIILVVTNRRSQDDIRLFESPQTRSEIAKELAD